MIIVMIIIILIIVQHLGYTSAVSNQQPLNKRSFTAFTNPKGASDSLTLSVSHIFLGLQNFSVGVSFAQVLPHAYVPSISSS